VTEKDLQKHMFDHHGIKADDDQVEFPDLERGGGMRRPSYYQCNICPKTFTRCHNLRAHLRSHTDERPYVCTVCGKAFERLYDRKRHEALHSGIRGSSARESCIQNQAPSGDVGAASPEPDR
jgi:hypothetical protein